MTLNASGPISLGGATTGQSINLELGVSATALASINATNFRTLAGVASGQISLSNFYGKSNISGWLAIYASTIPTTTNNAGVAISVDSSNNIYVIGQLTSAPALVKISSAGTLVSAYTYTDIGSWTSGDYQNCRMYIDASNNIYTLGVESTSVIASKFNTSLTRLNGRRFLIDPAVDYAYPAGLTVSSAGDIYYGGWGVHSDCCGTTFQGNLVKLNSSFTYQSALSNFRGNTLGTMSDVVIDTSGNVISVFFSNTIYKFSGFTSTALWKNNPYRTTNNNNIANAKLTIDSSNNLYVGYTGITAAIYCGICKLNSSGVLQWSRQLTTVTPGTAGGVNQVIVGDDGYIYAVGKVPIGSTYNYYGGFIVKYNSSGVIQWQRYLYNVNTGDNDFNIGLTGIKYTSVGLAITGGIKNNANTKTNWIIALIPTDGAGTGSYTISGVNVTYAASTNTEAAGGLLDYDPGVNMSTTTPSTAALTGTATAVTQTITKVSLA
jgi:hypothetical protein